MKKWSLAIITLGLLFMSMASMSNPVNLFILASGLFYCALGGWLFFRSKKKEEKQ